MTIRHERVRFPPRGLLGGRTRPCRPRLRQWPAGAGEGAHRPAAPATSPCFETAGGGGFGPPGEREPAQIEADLRDGFVTARVSTDYGASRKKTVERGDVERYRIGVDIGGTFTDLVMLDTVTGRLVNEKVLTTPADPSIGVLEGVGRILAANGVSAGDVEHVIHGTTLVANAVIERRGSTVALITTRGFGDVLQIGTEWRYDTYDLFMQLPEPLVPRHLRFEVGERIGPDGHVLEALNESDVARVAHEITAAGVATVAVSLLHSFRNPQHERRIREILQREAPELAVCLSSDVMPEIGEYERTSTTVCNAYVLPVFDTYLKRLTEGLRGRGVRKDLYLMLSDGGTVHESTAAAYPVRLVQSGPAGGVQAISAIGRVAGEANLLCFDMGGTTAKACLVDDGQPLRTTEFRSGARLSVQEGQRPAAARAGDRDDRDWRWWRLDRSGRCTRPGADRPREFERRSGSGLLWPRRSRSDRHRCRSGARLSVGRQFPRR